MHSFLIDFDTRTKKLQFIDFIEFNSRVMEKLQTQYQGTLASISIFRQHPFLSALRAVCLFGSVEFCSQTSQISRYRISDKSSVRKKILDTLPKCRVGISAVA